MSNKIDGISQRPVQPGGGARAPGPERTDRAGGSARSPETDKVTLTDSARQLQRLSEAVASAPEVDAAKVASVRESIERGEYKVDSDKVAARIIAAERELVGR